MLKLVHRPFSGHGVLVAAVGVVRWRRGRRKERRRSGVVVVVMRWMCVFMWEERSGFEVKAREPVVRMRAQTMQ